MNSREKGKRGERQWRDELRAAGYDARRGQQFAGGPDSPDVICPGLPWCHFEVKVVERLNIWDAMKQAIRDALGKIGIVAHKRNFGTWLVTMEAETFFRLLRGDFFTEGREGNEEEATSLRPTLTRNDLGTLGTASLPVTEKNNNNNERKDPSEDKR